MLAALINMSLVLPQLSEVVSLDLLKELQLHHQMARSTKRFIVTCMHSCSMVHVIHPAVYVYKAVLFIH